MNLGQADLSVGPDRTRTDKSQCGVKLSHSHTDKASAGKRSGVHPDGTGTCRSQERHYARKGTDRAGANKNRPIECVVHPVCWTKVK